MACDEFDECGDFHDEAGCLWSTVRLMQLGHEQGASGSGITMAKATIPYPFILARAEFYIHSEG